MQVADSWEGSKCAEPNFDMPDQQRLLPAHLMRNTAAQDLQVPLVAMQVV